jgi:hypothetical protein
MLRNPIQLQKSEQIMQNSRLNWITYLNAHSESTTGHHVKSWTPCLNVPFLPMKYLHLDVLADVLDFTLLGRSARSLPVVLHNHTIPLGSSLSTRSDMAAWKPIPDSFHPPQTHWWELWCLLHSPISPRPLLSTHMTTTRTLVLRMNQSLRSRTVTLNPRERDIQKMWCVVP